MSAAPSTDSADAAPPKTPPPSSLLPASSVKYVMRRAMGGDQDAITDESVEAMQRCTSEFLSFITSEARERAAREGRASVTYGDISGVLNVFGFRCASLSHAQ